MQSLFQKKTLATLIAASLPLLATAEVIGPTVYGRVNVSLESVDHEGAYRTVANGSVRPQDPQDEIQLNSNASRLGVKGSFDLDLHGLKAIYQLEYEVNVDDGTSGDSSFSQRNTFGGVQGGFGQVIFGKFDTPLKVAEGKVDQFNDLRGDIDWLIGGQNRVNDIVQYSSPKLLGGLTVTAAFVTAETLYDADGDGDLTNDDGLDSYSFSAVYDDGTWYGALAYDTDQAARRSFDGIVRADILRAVGGARLGNFEAGLLLQRAEDVAPNSSGQDDSWLVSGAYKLGAVKLKAQYGSSEGDVSGRKGTLAALGVDYARAKQSVLYAYWSQIEVDDAVFVTPAAVGDVADSTFGVGVSHSF
jgi:predicted porin